MVSPACPPAEPDAPPIDYLAKDFLSFRQALLDFSALRYPDWQERSEADFGVMFLEALSALADDLSYTQDRIAAEAGSTPRRSAARWSAMREWSTMNRAAQPLRASCCNSMWPTGCMRIAHGLAVNAAGPDGTPIVFETGEGLLEVLTDASGKRLSDSPTSIASPLWNADPKNADPGIAHKIPIRPYWLDDSERCLKAGARR